MDAGPHRAASSCDPEVLRLIIEGTVSDTGIDFFRHLVRNLATALGTSGAWVTEFHRPSRRLKAFALWLDGKFVEGYEYAID